MNKHPSQAILTKVLPWTDKKPRRYVASCTRGRIVSSEPLETADNETDYHRAVAQLLVEKFLAEDEKRRQPRESNPWNAPRIMGRLSNGDYVHVFPEQ